MAELRAGLKAVSGSTKDLRTAHRRIGKIVEQGSRAGAASGTAQQQRAASTLLAAGSVKGAELAIRNTSKVPFGLGAFLGGKRPQFPEWVGNRWDVLAGDGPYVIAQQIRTREPEIRDAFTEEVLTLFALIGLEVS